MQQNYSNHRKYYLPHHFVFLPLLGGLLTIGVTQIFKRAEKTEWILFSICIFCITYLTIMVRQHYALGNQDRIVRLEFRLRYLELFRESASAVEKRLSFYQIAALRFASDEEFKTLLKKALDENMKPDDIKKSIKDWQSDNMRV